MTEHGAIAHEQPAAWSSKVAVDILYAREDRTMVEPFIIELIRTGITVNTHKHGFDGTPGADVLVLILTPQLISSVAEGHMQKAIGQYADTVPVSYYPAAAPVLADLTHSLLSQVGPTEAARRIAAIARFGGKRIVDWNTLVDRAQTWRVAQDSQTLLSATELPTAMALFHGLRLAQKESTAQEVKRFLDVSSDKITRRRRRSMTVATATALVLVVALVIATVQTIGARTAQQRAELANAISTADRLSRTALTLKDGDPDLPSMLVDRASSLASTDSVRSARVQVAADTWPHVSMSLGFDPTMVTSSSGSNRIVVTSNDDLTIRVIDADALSEVSRLDCCKKSDNQPIRGFLDNSGEYLAVSSPGENRTFVVSADSPTESGNPVSGWTVDDVLLGWWSENELLVGRAGKVIAVDVKNGNYTPIVSMPTDSRIRAVGLSPNRRFLAVTNLDAVVLYDTSSMTVVRTFDEKSITALAVNDAGDFIYGSRYPTALAISVGAVASKDKLTESRLTSVSAISMGDDYMLAGARTEGMLALFGRGQDNLLAAVKGHRSDDVRLARLPDGRIVSVSYDGYLRRWQAPDAHRMGLPMPFGLSDQSATFADDNGVEIDPRESSRNQVRFTDADHVTVSMIPGYTWILNASDLQPPDRRNYFTGLDTETFFSRNGQYVGTVAGKYVRVYEYDGRDHFWRVSSEKRIDGKPPLMAVQGLGTGTANVSDSGRIITAADEYVVSNWDMEAGSTTSFTFTAPKKPVGLFSIDTGVSYALTGDGQVRGSDGSEVPLSSEISGLSSPIAAAEVSSFDDYSVVTVDGRVYRKTWATEMQVFDIGAGIEPFAVRKSTSGSSLAVLGKKALSVLDTKTGTMRYQEASIGGVYLTDVAIDDERDRAVGVSVIASVRTVDLSSPSLAVDAPRDPIPEESQSLMLDTDQPNG